MQRNKSPVNTGMINFNKKLAESKAEAEAKRNFYSFVDCENGNCLIFPLDGTFQKESDGGYTYKRYRPSTIYKMDQNSGKIVGKKVDRPSVPSCQAAEDAITKAMESGDTFGCLFDHEVSRYEKNGEQKKYHRINFSSHDNSENFLSSLIK